MTDKLPSLAAEIKPPPVRDVSELHFDGKFFWHKHPRARWEPLNTDSASRLLRVQYGLSGKRPDNKASEIDIALREAEQDYRVAAGAPFVHDARDLIEYRGETYLNISTTACVQPATTGDPADFPWLKEFFDKRWAEPAETQRDYFFAWLKRFYGSALSGKLLPGQHVLEAGERNTGKTLMSRKIIGAALGGSAGAGDFLKGATKFNSEAARFALWTMDDEDGTFTWEQRMSFSNSLKASAANQEVRCEPKFMNSYTVPWYGRVYLTCNLDARSLNILPDMSGGISDKILLFRGGDWLPTFLEREENEARIARELPHFLRWLLEWQVPDELKAERARFGIKSYHHPSLLRASKASSSETRLGEMLSEWRNAKPGEPRWFTATGLRKELSEDPSIRDGLREFSRDRMREALEEAGKDLVLERRDRYGNREFLIANSSTPQP